MRGFSVWRATLQHCLWCSNRWNCAFVDAAVFSSSADQTLRRPLIAGSFLSFLSSAPFSSFPWFFEIGEIYGIQTQFKGHWTSRPHRSEDDHRSSRVSDNVQQSRHKRLNGRNNAQGNVDLKHYIASSLELKSNLELRQHLFDVKNEHLYRNRMPASESAWCSNLWLAVMTIGPRKYIRRLGKVGWGWETAIRNGCHDAWHLIRTANAGFGDFYFDKAIFLS